jgi:hypothetical protein
MHYTAFVATTSSWPLSQKSSNPLPPQSAYLPTQLTRISYSQLYYSVDSYHQLVLSNGTRFGFEGDRNDAHAAHCFEYVRNQILCMADMTLEGSQSILGAKGDGQPHMCRNRDEAVAWIEERRMDDIQSIVGP